jgi:hypothetical protein
LTKNSNVAVLDTLRVSARLLLLEEAVDEEVLLQMEHLLSVSAVEV